MIEGSTLISRKRHSEMSAWTGAPASFCNRKSIRASEYTPKTSQVWQHSWSNALLVLHRSRVIANGSKRWCPRPLDLNLLALSQYQLISLGFEGIVIEELNTSCRFVMIE